MAQRGFPAHSANIVEMGAMSRILARAADAGVSPTLLLRDLEAASPSVPRRFLIAAALRAEVLPTALCAGVEGALYGPRLAFRARLCGHCVATSGVARGCRMSGALFVAAMGPALRCFRAGLRRRRAGMAR